MARRHIRRDISGKGWKHTQALKSGKDGHIVNPLTTPSDPPVEPEIEVLIEPEPVVKEIKAEILEPLVEVVEPVADMSAPVEPASDPKPVKEKKPPKGRWARGKGKAKKKKTTKKTD